MSAENNVKGWEDCLKNMTAVAVENAIARRGYFMLDGCETYVKCYVGIGKKIVLISNVAASDPGTGQFRSMITRMEQEAKRLGYPEMRLDTITNPKLLEMLAKHGYECTYSSTDDGEHVWDGTAIKQLS